MNEDFIRWLDDELRKRGWSQSEAARRGGISASMINAIVNRQTNPGLDFCRGLARAFNMPLEDVFRRAGILPALVELPDEAKDWGERLLYLTEEDRRRAVEMMEQVLKFAEERPEYRSRRRRSGTG